jgi:flagellar motility protein MotE (MotC chaperone)
MSTVEEIRTAIERLSLEERAQIIAELCGWTDDDWDRQMKADAAAGKFAALNREADAAHAVGQTRHLNDILHEP